MRRVAAPRPREGPGTAPRVAMDVAITAVEKFPGDLEKCTELIKQTMDKKFGAPWHVVAGKGFAYSCTYECKHLLYIFVGGQTGVLLWKM